MTPASPVAAPSTAARLSRGTRHDVLLDEAARLLAEGGFSAVTMEAVASGAGVSRPLVYKHFGNREALMTALWRREAAAIDERAGAALSRADGFETIIRKTVEATLDALDRQGLIVAPLLHSELFGPEIRHEQAARRRRNRSWYAARVVDEFGISQSEAEAAITMYFGGLHSMIADFRSSRNQRTRHQLVEVYVEMVMGGLRALQTRRSSR